jgi:hypothetical protein
MKYYVCAFLLSLIRCHVNLMKQKLITAYEREVTTQR